uniref:Uncharacterized protein n=1 Tax=Arundo donax TaxID=35708 RepID=A0A0A9EBA9_ARUDO
MFQTFETQGQVVSTICTFFSFSVYISSTAAPNAGNTTTSPWSTTLKSLIPASTGMISTPISSNLLLTVGLWMISLVSQMRSSGNCLRAS